MISSKKASTTSAKSRPKYTPKYVTNNTWLPNAMINITSMGTATINKIFLAIHQRVPICNHLPHIELSATQVVSDQGLYPKGQLSHFVPGSIGFTPGLCATPEKLSCAKEFIGEKKNKYNIIVMYFIGH